MFRILNETVNYLPKKTKISNGVNSIDILGAKEGIDMFDCVMPTRLEEPGFTWEGKLNLNNSKYKYDKSPLDNNCDIKVS